MKRYSPAEIEFIRDNHQHMSYRKIAAILGREENSIRQYCYVLKRDSLKLEKSMKYWKEKLKPSGLKAKKGYSPADIEFIVKNYHTMTYGNIAIAIGREELSIKQFCHVLRREGLIGTKHNNQFSKEDKTFIQEHFESMTWEQIANSLGKKRRSVIRFAYSLELKRTKANQKGKKTYDISSLKLAKAMLTFGCKNLKPSDISDELAEIELLKIKFNRTLKSLHAGSGLLK